MYKEKMAVALKHNGKVLREVGESVYLPFGSEYSIFIKNMNSIRALVSITIDGQDVGDGSKFVVNANDDINIERFIKNGNLNNGNRFKFIERTENIEAHRGIKVEDGLIRIEFNFERMYSYPSYNTFGPYIKDIINEPWTYTTNVGESKARSITRSLSTNVINTAVSNDVGITVPGSVSDQHFQSVSDFPVEDTTHVMVFQLFGQTESNQPVVQPVTVKTKPKCTSCGRVNKATAKFCTECGTSLTLV